MGAATILLLLFVGVTVGTLIAQEVARTGPQQMAGNEPILPAEPEADTARESAIEDRQRVEPAEYHGLKMPLWLARPRQPSLAVSLGKGDKISRCAACLPAEGSLRNRKSDVVQHTNACLSFGSICQQCPDRRRQV